VALLDILRTCLELNKTDGQANPSKRMSELSNLLPLFDCLDPKSRVGLAREILESLQNRAEDSESASPDPESILYLSGVLADSVNALTIQGQDLIQLL
jgi:hypothetical protein